MTSQKPGSKHLRVIRSIIIDWFSKHGRKFPWRDSSNPYEVLIAEILLRRTTATAVDRVYPLFLKRYDTVEKLARSRRNSLEQILSSLGLQSKRARDLRELASQIVIEHCGEVPSDFDSLEALPGVGRYIANAVLNFAFNLPCALVDGNVIHLINRIFKCNFHSPTEDSAWKFMKRFGGRGQEDRFYWGIIDLVAAICLRKKPRCSICPVNAHCAYASDLAD
jgi:A/G-specific adenine glycosylase